MSESRFLYVLRDEGGCDIEPSPRVVFAEDLRHALQKVTTQLLPVDAVSVDVWVAPLSGITTAYSPLWAITTAY